MSNLIVYGFPRSTFVNVVRLVLTHKEVPYTFHDLEPESFKTALNNSSHRRELSTAHYDCRHATIR